MPKAPCKRTQHCCPTTPNIVRCYMLRPFDLVACCWMLLRDVAQSLKPVKLFSHQLPTFLLFRDRRSEAQQRWIRLHSSSNIVGATNAHYPWITKTYGLYSSHDALQVSNLFGVVASVCTPLPTRTQQLSTLLAQQCWELLANNVASVCTGLNACMTIFPWKNVYRFRELANKRTALDRCWSTQISSSSFFYYYSYLLFWLEILTAKAFYRKHWSKLG